VYLCYDPYSSCTVPVHLFISGEFSKLRKEAVSFVMSVCPSAWNKSAPTRHIFITFDI